jgi:hypothetical protein
MEAALDGTKRKRIDHQPRLSAGLDRKEAGKPKAHCHSLIKRRANCAVPPFPN